MPAPLLRATLSLFLLAALLLPPGASAESLQLAVAANFRSAAEQLARRYEAGGGDTLRISSASTGVLAAQLRRGAPFDLLLAADRERPQALAEAGYGAGPARCYAVGSLVLVGAPSLDALAQRGLSLAIANPATAPYGAAAMQVLARPEFAAVTNRRIVRGQNVAQAWQFYRSGAADLALVARSLAQREGIPVPGDWHAPIEQYALVNARGGGQGRARAFLDYLRGEAAQALLREQGYRPCH